MMTAREKKREAAWTVSEVRLRLEELAEEAYRDFHSSLIPGIDRVLGVRMPAMRSLAREIAGGDFRSYLEEARHLSPEDPQASHEEIMMQGLVIGAAKMETEERMQALKWFVPKIHSWAVCDCCCAGYKWMAREPEVWYPWLLGWLKSGREYELRFGVVALLDHFITSEYIDRLLELFPAIRHPGYYVKMAVAWAVSICYVKFPEKTEELLARQVLDPFTQNKSIQKARESYRVAPEQKERLRAYRIVTKEEIQP